MQAMEIMGIIVFCYGASYDVSVLCAAYDVSVLRAAYDVSTPCGI